MFNDDGHCNIHQNGYSFNKKNDKNNIIRINLPEVKTSVTIDLTYGECKREYGALNVHVPAGLPSLWADFSTQHIKFYAGTGHESKFLHEIKKFMWKITSIT